MRGLIISITIIGETKKNGAVKRSGAKINDQIFVTGTLGDSAAGLSLLKRDKARKSKLADKHLSPMPRLEEGRWLAEKGGTSAMIDISDGLENDLKRISEESKCGAKIYIEKIPLSYSMQKLKITNEKKISYALQGGEDYELLLTVRRKKAEYLQKKWPNKKIRLTHIGEISDKDKGIILVDRKGHEKSLDMGGFDHFK